MTEQEKSDLEAILETHATESELIPEDFVAYARIVYTDGTDRLVSPMALDEIFSSEDSLEDQGIDYVRLILDMALIRETVIYYTNEILGSSPRE